MLAAYAFMIKWLADHEWIPASAVGKAGGSIVGVLSMGTSRSVTGPPLDPDEVYHGYARP